MARIPKQNDLFQIEDQILQDALNEVNNDRFDGNPLLPQYQALTQHYDKLLRQSIKLLKISDSQHRNLQKVQKDMRNLLDNAGQGFLTFGQELTVDKEYSAECLKIFGTKIESQNIIDLIFCNYDMEQRILIKELLQSLWNEQRDPKKQTLQKLPDLVDINGSNYRLEYRPIKTIRDDEGQEVIMMVITDVTERQKAAAQIDYLSSHDKLTGLYNRAYIDTALIKLNDEADLPMAMIIGDVNGLKITNDVFGHLAGDLLLQNITGVLRKCLRENDLIARWGGDEFLIILPRTDENLVSLVCQRIKDTCAETPPDPIKLSIALGTASRRNVNESYAEIFSRAEDQMYDNKLQEKPQAHEEFLLAIQRKLGINTTEKEEHIERMKKMALAMAEKLGFDAVQTKELETLVQMHDIGKVAIPFEILNKSGLLDDDEWQTVQKHCEIGYRMCQALSDYQLADYILAHHEHWDGSGYPYGLKGENIPLPARILSIIDAFDIMTHDVPYKRAMPVNKALTELEHCSGSQFDPELVQVFKRVVKPTKQAGIFAIQ